MLINRLSCSPKNYCMEYSRIVAVTGMPGLYEILNSKTDGAIVRSLDDNATKFISSRVHNLSHLESIEIFTNGDNVLLSDVLAAMKSNADSLPDVKDNKAVRAYFEKVYPQMDFERVYASDMKKIINWFSAIQKHNIDFTPKEEEQQEEGAATEKAATIEVANENAEVATEKATAKPKAKTKKTKNAD